MPKSVDQPSFSGMSGKKQKLAGSPPPKLPNLQKRSREYLTVSEVNKLIKTAKTLGRHGERDSLVILVMYRHALRVGELVDLHRDQLDLNRGRMHVNRLKNGDPSVHYLEGDEIRALRKLRRDYPVTDFVFESERQGPLTASAIRNGRKGRQRGRTGVKCAPSYTPARKGVSTCLRRHRYEGYTSLHGAQKHSAYGFIHPA